MSNSQAWNAELYDDRHAFVWKHGASVVALLNPQPGERVLDLGCGTGHLTAQIAAAGAEVVGIDASAAMIDEARRTYPKLEFVTADAREYRGPTAFDAVFSNAALHWIRPPEAAAATIAAALRTGGRLVAEFGGHGNVAAIAEALRELAPGYFDLRLVPDWYFPGIAEYTTLLEKAGLETTQAMLFDRPTKLEGDQGLRNWAAMFAENAIAGIEPPRREDFFQKLEDALRRKLYREGAWYADYRRLRITAQKR